jgi:hypothetical protein
MRQVVDRPAPGRGPSAPDQRAPPPVLLEYLALRKGVNITKLEMITRAWRHVGVKYRTMCNKLNVLTYIIEKFT